MRYKPFPGYEMHLETYRILAHGTEEEKQQAFKSQQAQIRKPDLTGVSFRDIFIPGDEGRQLRLRICTPDGSTGSLPIVYDIHGGGWVAGVPEIDDYRNSLMAKGIPAVVVAVEYSLSTPEVHFPTPLMDCLKGLEYVAAHGDEIGGDASRIAVHGTSAGGNLAAGLCLYIRDHGGPQLKAQVLVNPGLGFGGSPSRHQNETYAMGDNSDWPRCAEHIYYGDLNGQNPNYYAFPLSCDVLYGLPPAIVIGAEYDPLRDDAVIYADKLMKSDVPCELYVAPRVGHGFCTVPGQITQWIMDGICLSLKREFGML